MLNEDVVAELDLLDHLPRHICPQLLLLFNELPQPLAGEDILCANVDGPWEARTLVCTKTGNGPVAAKPNVASASYKFSSRRAGGWTWFLAHLRLPAAPLEHRLTLYPDTRVHSLFLDILLAHSCSLVSAGLGRTGQRSPEELRNMFLKCRTTHGLPPVSWRCQR